MLSRVIVLFLSIHTLSFTYGLIEDVSYKLPKNVKPIRYNLTIVPIFETSSFSGTVSIEIVALEDTNYITLHAYNLNMPSKENITVQNLSSNKFFPVKSAEASNSEYQYYTITLSEMLIENSTYVLTIPNFNSHFVNGAYGFASGTFTDADGSIRYFAYTDFEPCFARRVFPCFDEPALRAKFNIHLIRPNEQFISASNSPLISQSSNAPFEDVFEETVDMPTYLVAFTISEMRFSDTLDRYRIIATPEALDKDQHKFALNVTVKVVDFMEFYTRTPFSLPKLDQVGFSTFSGGMENWGLIIYEESSLLLHQDSSKSSIVLTVAHEIAHQWFGNLIGLLWWEYVWLNEGFATYFELLIPRQIEQTIDGRDAFLGYLQIALQYDVSLNRPLNKNVKNPNDILYLFDRIAYNKGAAVLHMLQNSLTTPVFQKGVQYYVEDMQFKQVTPLDLYEKLQRAVDEIKNTLPEFLSVIDFMSSWDSVKGFPVVDVYRTYDANKDIVVLSQKRYTRDSMDEDAQWIIPINFATTTSPTFDNTDPDYWITEKQQTISIPDLNGNDWLIANKQETGYYRVNYDEENWELLTKALKINHLDIHVLNRAQLIDDTLNLARTKHLNYDIAIKLVSYLESEMDPIPWKSYERNTRALGTFFYYSPNYHVFKEYNFNLTTSVYNYLGFEEKLEESVLEKDLRKIILNLLCKLDHPECIHKSLNKFKSWQKSRRDISTLSENSLCGAIRAGYPADFDYLFSILKNTDQSPIAIIKGLSCSKDSNNLNRLLYVNDKIPIEKLIDIVMNASPEGLEAVITFVFQNFASLEEKFEAKIMFLLRNICKLISTNHQLQKLSEAVSKSKKRDFIKECLAESEKNIAWRKHNLELVSNKLVF